MRRNISRAAALLLVWLRRPPARREARARSHKASVDVCVLLPDTKSSVRWVQFDAPAMAAAFKKAGVSASINNALNDPLKQKAQAQACIAAGAKVVIETALDNGSAASIEKLFTVKGGKAIDYDRQVIGGTRLGLRHLRRRERRQGPGQRRHRRDEGERHLQGRHRRRALGRPDRPERVLVQERQRRRLQPALQERHDQEGPAAVRPRLGCEQRGDDLQPDARQDEQQHPGRPRRERQHRRRGDRRSEGEGPQADPARGPGRERRRASSTSSPAGRRARSTSTSRTRRTPRPRPRSRCSRARSRRRTRPQERQRERADARAAGRLDHEGELQAPLHGRVPEEERRLHRRRTRSTASRISTIGGGALRGASTVTLEPDERQPLHYSSSATSASPSGRSRRCPTSTSRCGPAR